MSFFAQMKQMQKFMEWHIETDHQCSKCEDVALTADLLKLKQWLSCVQLQKDQYQHTYPKKLNKSKQDSWPHSSIGDKLCLMEYVGVFMCLGAAGRW